MSFAHRLGRYLESEGTGYETPEHPCMLTSSRSVQAAHMSGELLVKSVILLHELGYVVAVAASTHHMELDTLQGPLNLRLGGAAYGLAVIIDESVAHLAKCSSKVVIMRPWFALPGLLSGD